MEPTNCSHPISYMNEACRTNRRAMSHTYICHKRIYITHVYMAHTYICHTRICITHVYISHTYICRTSINITHAYISHTYICHTSIYITHIYISHTYICHTLICVTHISISHTYICHTRIDISPYISCTHTHQQVMSHTQHTHNRIPWSSDTFLLTGKKVHKNSL